MTILEELTRYANDCISDKIPSCQKHKWACMRFLHDVEHQEKYFWSEAYAKQIVDWFSLLYHCKGTLAGKPITLTTSQKFTVCQIFAWRDRETGYKRFTHSFKEVGRKNAKSQEQAGIVLYCMAVESSEMGEIYETYCAGTKRDQSAIIFNECKNMLAKSPLLRKFKITKSQITHRKTGSFLKALSRDDGKTGDGTNPAVLILDEYHQHPDTSFYELGIGGNTKQALLMIITTAGKNLNAPCYVQEYAYASNLLNPDVDIQNEHYFADVYEAEQGDDLGSPETWKKANPIRAYYQEGIDKISQAWQIAQEVPEKLTSFKTKALNIWVQASVNGYMNMAKWKRCEIGKFKQNLKGLPVDIGFDMSAKIDLTSVAFIIPIKQDNKIIYLLHSHSFVPNRDILRQHEIIDKAPYLSWADNGYISVTESEIVNQTAVMQYVRGYVTSQGLDVQMLCFDPANASKLIMDLSAEGYPCCEVYQSYKSLNETTSGFREQVYEENIQYLQNPVLNFAMANAVLRVNDGLIKIDKDSGKKRIDPVDATLCAFKLALYHDFGDMQINVHYAKITDWNEDGTPKFATPKRLAGAVSLSTSASGEAENFYADDGVYYVINNNSGYTGDLEVALITTEFATEILGEELDSKGVLVERTDAELAQYALLFEFSGDKKKIRHVMYCCSASRVSAEGQTSEDKKTVKTEKLSFKAAPLANGLVKSRTCESTDETTYTNWYQSVYMPQKSESGEA